MKAFLRSTISLLMLLPVILYGQSKSSERPNILVVDGQSGATYAMTKCDERGAFAFVGIRPGQYVLKAEFEHPIIDGVEGKPVPGLDQFIVGGLDVLNGKALMKVKSHLYVLEMEMQETPKRLFLPEYRFEKNDKYYVVAFSRARLDEVSTLRGNFKKANANHYKKLSASKSLVAFEP